MSLPNCIQANTLIARSIKSSRVHCSDVQYLLRMWFSQNYVNSCLAWAAPLQTDPRQGMMPVVGVAKGHWVPPPSSESTWNPLKNPFCPGRSTWL